MQIRDAVQADFEQITAIYNEVLTNSTAIYNDRPASVSDRIAWVARAHRAALPRPCCNRRRGHLRLRQQAGKHSMIAGVDSENTASLRFLERFGFERVGHLREVGYKFDRFLDLILLQYWITPRIASALKEPLNTRA